MSVYKCVYVLMYRNQKLTWLLLFFVCVCFSSSSFETDYLTDPSAHRLIKAGQSTLGILLYLPLRCEVTIMHHCCFSS